MNDNEKRAINYCLVDLVKQLDNVPSIAQMLNSLKVFGLFDLEKIQAKPTRFERVIELVQILKCRSASFGPFVDSIRTFPTQAFLADQIITELRNNREKLICAALRRSEILHASSMRAAFSLNDTLQKEILDRNIVTLSSNMNESDTIMVAVRLLSYRLFSDFTFQQIQETTSRNQKTIKLIDFIQKRGGEAFHVFIMSLIYDAQQVQLADQLIAELNFYRNWEITSQKLPSDYFDAWAGQFEKSKEWGVNDFIGSVAASQALDLQNESSNIAPTTLYSVD